VRSGQQQSGKGVKMNDNDLRGNRTEAEAQAEIQKRYDEMNEELGIPLHKLGSNHSMLRLLRAIGQRLKSGEGKIGEADCSTCNAADCDDRDAEFSGEGDGMPKPKSSQIEFADEELDIKIAKLDLPEKASDQFRSAIDRMAATNNSWEQAGIALEMLAEEREHSSKMILAERQRNVAARDRAYSSGNHHGIVDGKLYALVYCMEEMAHAGSRLMSNAGFEDNSTDHQELFRDMKRINMDLGAFRTQMFKINDELKNSE